MAVHEIKANPTIEMVIDGVECSLELGNYTFALEAKRWADGLAEFRRDGDPTDIDAMEGIAASGIAIVSSALGDDAAEKLMGGRNRLNIVRLVAIIDIIMGELASEDGMRAQMDAVAEFADTGDRD